MGHLKLKDGTNFPLNLSVGDIRDISKRSGAFSKTITLVGDDDNNNLLNHYYDVNVVAGTFDVNKLQQCQIIQNGIVILDNAYMQLVEVVKTQTTDAHNQQIEYKVLVKDSVSDFFTKLGNKTLNDINMDEIVTGGTPIVYTAANVTGSFNNTITDGYKFVLPQDTDNLYNTKAFHPAMYAKTYFDAIFQGAGFTYEWGNQSPSVHTTNDNYFEKLLIPYNGGTPQRDTSDYLVEATKAGLTTAQTGFNWTEQIIGFTEVTDLENIFDPTNGDYSVPVNIQNPENIQIEVTINYDLTLVNNDSGTYPTATLVPGSGDLGVAVSSKAQSQSNYHQALFTGIVTPPSSFTSPDTIVSGANTIVTIPVTNVLNTDTLELFLQSDTTGLLQYKDNGTGTILNVDLDVTINSSTWKIIPSSDTIGYNSNLDLNVYIPNKVKQADYIKSIFTMYNLYAEVDSIQPNKLILRSRDDYYDAGAEVDWTEKLAKDKDQTLQFLPELSSKKMVLSYKDDKDDINTIYKEATSETYGQIEYTFENEYVKGVDRKEIIFSPTPIVKTPFNAYVPALSYIPEVNIRILVDGGTQTCDEFDIYDYYSGSTGVGQLAQTTAPLIAHFDDPETPSFDLNFATCDYYFYSDLSQKTNNNLYNLYWRRTLGQIDKGKMLTAWFDLNEVDIQSLKLNDKIRIDNSWWHINRVIDYDANEHKLTKVELISVDEEIEFTPFATSPTIPVKPTSPANPNPVRPTRPFTNRPVKDIVKKNNEAKNLIQGDVEVKGLNNTIGSDVTKAYVIGDNLDVTDDGIHTEKLFINGIETTGNLANIDLEQTDKVRTYKIPDASGGTLLFTNANDNDIIYFSQDEVVINNDAQDHDFRVEGQTDANLFFVDASTDRVGIGTGSPSQKFHVEDSGSLNALLKSTSSETFLRIDGATGFDSGIQLYENSTAKWLINNDSSTGNDFRIYSYSAAVSSLFVDGTSNNVGINQNTASYQLDVNGDVNVASGSAYYHNGTAGLSATYTFGGGTTGDIATMTFNGGILTAVTTVP